jgi:hypothetical protein
MVQYERIIKECFWDSNITPKQLEKIIQDNDQREMAKIFSKIIYNSSDKLNDLQIFTKYQLKKYFDELKITYNKRYIQKHVLILRSLLLGEKHYIKGLEWEKK